VGNDGLDLNIVVKCCYARHFGEPWVGENLSDGQADALLSRLGDEVDGADGVAANLEEIVLPSNLLKLGETKHLGPDFRQLCLQVGQRLRVIVTMQSL